ncbi:MAG: hypothetical protein ABSB54_03645 [Acidimicrobiales bacterium]|jgi:hypothetical protein
MIRFAWMQSRTQALVAFGGLVVVAVVVAVTGPHLVHLYDTSVATCQARGDCQTATTAFLNEDHTLGVWLGVLVVAVPGILGVFWGAPLVARELETGSFRLAWTQSVSRKRWLAVKLGVVGLAALAVAGLLSLMATWWSSPIDRVNLNLFGVFDQRDIVPVGYAAFAFVLGVAAGVVIRRTLPAMATTLAAFVACRLAFNHWIRPHLIAPVVRNFALSIGGFGSTNGGPFTLIPNPPGIPNAWIISVQIRDRAGGGLANQYLQKVCPNLGQPPAPGTGGIPGGGVGARVAPGGANGLQECGVKLSAMFHEVVTYQPANRYWTFQWYELAIYLVASLILAGVCIWWVRRRLS